MRQPSAKTSWEPHSGQRRPVAMSAVERAADEARTVRRAGAALPHHHPGGRPEEPGLSLSKGRPYGALGGEELQLQPAEDVVDDAGGLGDLRVGRKAGRLEVDALELVDQGPQRHAVL